MRGREREEREGLRNGVRKRGEGGSNGTREGKGRETSREVP